MRISPHNRLLCLVLTAVLCPASSGYAQTDEPAGQESGTAPIGLEAVLDRVRARTGKAKAELAEREAEYRRERDAARQKVAKAQSRLTALEADSAALENRFDAYEAELDRKAKLLQDKIGALKELFGVFQQTASDLIGAFNDSPTSIQYPNRDQWLEGFANRMKNASEVSSVADIKRLWFEMQREITASGRIVRLTAPVVGADGRTDPRPFVRVGTFSLITDEPEPAYLVWQPNSQYVAGLDRQPDGGYLDDIDAYLEAEQGTHTLGVDPTGGALLSLLVETPTLAERIDQGGLVGYLILALGALALLLAGYKLLDIFTIDNRVRAQRRDLNNPSDDNALGRLLLTYREHHRADPETLEMRLDEQLLRQRNRINRFIVFLGIIAAVAPLMGLLGTVVGMINTFQAITLYGTGDPQTMAGGISQALITTVLGLMVAVPTVLLHAIVGGRAKAVTNILQQQVTALTADRLETRIEPRERPAGYGPDPQPTPA